MKHVTLLLCGIWLLTSCAPTRVVRSLEEGERTIGGSLGGPMTDVPGIGKLPIPFLTVGYSEGLKNDFTVFGYANLTSGLYGNYQGEFGVLRDLWKDSVNFKSAQIFEILKEQGVSASFTSNLALDNQWKNFRLWPQVDINYWLSRKQTTFTNQMNNNKRGFYTGVSTWFELNGTGAHGRKQEVRVVPSPQLGGWFMMERWEFSLETKYIAPFSSNEKVVLDYASPFGANNGALGLYLGIHFHFTKNAE